jgi:hypothetical protein
VEELTAVVDLLGAQALDPQQRAAFEIADDEGEVAESAD